MDEQGAAEIGGPPEQPETAPEVDLPDLTQLGVGGDGAAAGETEVPVNFESGTQPGPDGQPWVWFAIGIGLTNFKLILPEATARKVAKVLPTVITEAAIAARRQKLGLHVASVDQMPTGPVGPPFGLPGMNGQRHG